MADTLTRTDVQQLLQDPSEQNRAGMAVKVAAQIDETDLTAEERQIAMDIVRVMAKDTAQMVRESLATNIKTSRNMPKDVILALAKDVDEVAVPILEFSELLTDEDLVQIIESTGESKQSAIARREVVSEAVSEALVETENVNVVTALVANPGADISERAMNSVVDKFGDLEQVQVPLVQRAKLPVTVAERLVSMVSEKLREYLVKNHELSSDTASELIMRTRERATINLVSSSADEDDVEKLVQQLMRTGRLSPSLVLRALCCGDVQFFESALAALARVPVVNARILIHDAGQLGLKSLYEKAGMPMSLYPAIKTAMKVAHQTDFQSGDYDRDSYSRKILERILTDCDELRAEDADYLLRKLNDIAPPELTA